MAEIIKEYPLANIARIDFITEEEVPKTYTLTEVATEANIEAFISEGIDEELRTKRTIKAQNRTPDIVKGYNITMEHATMIPEIVALVDGGVYDDSTKEYTAPPMGEAVERSRFTLVIYSEVKDGDSSTPEYVKFTYLNCEGKPASFSLVDGGFFSPTLEITSRPKVGESPGSWKIVKELPA